jgi:hypothetical protein
MRTRATILCSSLLLLLAMVGGSSRATMSAFSAVTGSANTFASAVSFPSACPTRATPAFLTGMEHGAAAIGIFSAFNATGGSITADPAITRTGNYSMKVTDSSSANPTRVDVAVSGAVTVLRFGLRFETLPAADLTHVARVTLPAQSDFALAYKTATQKLEVQVGSTTQLATSAVTAGRWHLIDIKFDASVNPATVTWRIDGVAQTQLSKAQTADVADVATFGSPTSTDVFTAWYDDITVTNTASDYPIGDSGILGLSPTGMGYINNPSTVLQDDDSTAVDTTTWQRLDDRPMTSLTDYVKQTAVDASAIARFDFADVPAGTCVNGVSGTVAFHSSGSSANAATTSVLEGAASTTVYSGDMSPGTGTLQYKTTVIPPAAGGWDATKLNSLIGEAGRASNVATQPYWDAAMLEYDRSPTAASVYESAVLADSPAGFWRLGDTSGSTAATRSGSPAGTYVGAPLLGVGGATADGDGAVGFDGSTQSAGFGDVYDYSGTASFSVEMWIKPGTSNQNSWQALADKVLHRSSSDRDGWAIWIAPANDADPLWQSRLQFDRWNGTTQHGQPSGGTKLQTGVWYHIVCTYDGTTSRVYVNGALDKSRATTLSIPNTTATLKLAGAQTAADAFGGVMDDVSVYPTALSAARVTAHYNAGRP